MGIWFHNITHKSTNKNRLYLQREHEDKYEYGVLAFAQQYNFIGNEYMSISVRKPFTSSVCEDVEVAVVVAGIGVIMHAKNYKNAFRKNLQ